MTTNNSIPPNTSTPSLRLADTLSLIVGIVVGSAIYVLPANVASQTPSVPVLLGIWLVGGALSTIGAMCYAELAAADPRSGGDFNYISQAYGRRFGVAYGWMQLSAIIPGNIAVMSLVFGEHVHRGFAPGVPTYCLSLLSVAALALVNLAGAVMSKHTQNVLTVLKVAGLSLILLAGFLAAAPSAESVTDVDSTAVSEAGSGSLALALILAMYAYGGWSEAAYVAAEVRDARKNVPRALVLGMGCITLLYLFINLAYLHGLGRQGLADSSTPASDLVVSSFGSNAGRWMDALVAVSALGAIQGMIFAGSRLVAVVGDGHAFLGVLGRLNARRAPIWAIFLVTFLACLAITAFATDVIRGPLGRLLESATGREFEWSSGKDALSSLVDAMAPVVWFYFMLGGLTVVLLRMRFGSNRSPVKVPGYPVTPIIFCVTCLWMGVEAARYSGGMTLAGLVPMLLGLPFVLGPGISVRVSQEGNDEK